MKMFISFSMIMMSILMIFMNHPMSMGMMILIQTILLALITGMMLKTYWFSYILMLTFLGGLLVLFIYVSSISSNEMFKFSMKMKLMMFFFITLIFFYFMFYKNNLIKMNYMMNNEMNNFFHIYFMNNENKINLSKLYNNQTFLNTIMLIIYLFITLVTIVKITNIFMGTMRSSFN